MPPHPVPRRKQQTEQIARAMGGGEMAGVIDALKRNAKAKAKINVKASAPGAVQQQ